MIKKWAKGKEGVDLVTFGKVYVNSLPVYVINIKKKEKQL